MFCLPDASADRFYLSCAPARKLIIVKIDTRRRKKEIRLLRDVKITIALILISGRRRPGANLRKLRMHDRATHIRPRAYLRARYLVVILLTTLAAPTCYELYTLRSRILPTYE